MCRHVIHLLYISERKARTGENRRDMRYCAHTTFSMKLYNARCTASFVLVILISTSDMDGIRITIVGNRSIDGYLIA